MPAIVLLGLAAAGTASALFVAVQARHFGCADCRLPASRSVVDQRAILKPFPRRWGR
jgi:hypothetical protein